VKSAISSPANDIHETVLCLPFFTIHPLPAAQPPN
jgi:hypothetical protein